MLERGDKILEKPEILERKEMELEEEDFDERMEQPKDPLQHQILKEEDEEIVEQEILDIPEYFIDYDQVIF